MYNFFLTRSLEVQYRNPTIQRLEANIDEDKGLFVLFCVGLRVMKY